MLTKPEKNYLWIYPNEDRAEALAKKIGEAGSLEEAVDFLADSMTNSDISWTEETPEVWIRTGECTRCGQCCEQHHLFNYYATGDKSNENAPPLPKNAPVAPHGFKIGVPIAQEHWEGYWRYWQRQDRILEDKACEAFVDGLCTLHELEEGGKPEICRKWPIMPNDIEPFPECGFSFEKLEDECKEESDENHQSSVVSR